MYGKNSSEDDKCCICYKETSSLLPCCKQGCCNSCAENWAIKTPKPTCPMCRKEFYLDLTSIPKDDKVIVKRLHGKSSIVGTIKSCKKVLKVFAKGKTYHVPYDVIESYRICKAPLAFACGHIRTKWIKWRGTGFNGKEHLWPSQPQCSQLCLLPSYTDVERDDIHSDLDFVIYNDSDSDNDEDATRREDELEHELWEQRIAQMMKESEDRIAQHLLHLP